MNTETLTALVRLVIALALPALTAAGISIDVDILYIAVGAVASLVAIGWAWWKNENVTEAAQKAQVFLDDLKSAEASKE